MTAEYAEEAMAQVAETMFDPGEQGHPMAFSRRHIRSLLPQKTPEEVEWEMTEREKFRR